MLAGRLAFGATAGGGALAGRSLLVLRPIIAAGCPLIGSTYLYQQGGVLYPGLLDMRS
jgi:hypothetical protein